MERMRLAAAFAAAPVSRPSSRDEDSSHRSNDLLHPLNANKHIANQSSSNYPTLLWVSDPGSEATNFCLIGASGYEAGDASDTQMDCNANRTASFEPQS